MDFDRINKVAQQAPAIGLAMALTGATVWLVHEGCMAYFPPMENVVDTAMHIVMRSTKVAVILLAMPAICILHEYIYWNPRRLAHAFAVLMVLFVGAALLYLPFRESFAVFVSDSEYKLYFMNPEPPLTTYAFGGGLAPWREAWSRGIPQAKEFCMLVLVCTILLAPGALWRWASVTALLSWLAAGIAIIVLPVFLGLTVWDFDTFFGGVFFDMLSVDLLPMAWWWAGRSAIVLYSGAALFYAAILITPAVTPSEAAPKADPPA